MTVATAQTRWVGEVAKWAKAGATRAECSNRLADFGVRSHAYRNAILRVANVEHGLGWNTLTIAARAERARAVDARIADLKAQGVTRAEAQRIFVAEYGVSRDTVDEWIRDAYPPRTTAAPPAAPAAPPAARALVAAIEADLRADGITDAVVCACQYDSDKDAALWGAAICYGDPARIILAHDADDWRRQYREEPSYARAS